MRENKENTLPLQKDITSTMATSKQYLNDILGQLAAVEGITHRAMMGEYIIYYQGKVIGGLYDDRFLVKLTRGSKALLPDAPEQIPYEGAKPMLSISDIIFDSHPENTDLFQRLFTAILNDLK